MQNLFVNTRCNEPGPMAGIGPFMSVDTQRNPLTAHAHALAGHPMSGADIIVQVLADEGVDTIFGYSGGAILPTYDAVFRFNQAHARDGVEPMPLIVPANEQGAGFLDFIFLFLERQEIRLHGIDDHGNHHKKEEGHQEDDDKGGIFPFSIF